MSQDTVCRRDRLFVPLATDPFVWFKSGRKTWELRRYGRQYTEKHVTIGRLVELRLGYSRKERALWGTINKVLRARSLEEFFELVPYERVLPTATSRQEAIVQALRILRLDNASEPVLGFSISLQEEADQMPQVIPLDPKYLSLVDDGRKTATVRRGHRPYKIGAALLRIGECDVPIAIRDVRLTQVNQLTDVDARRDGFADLSQLSSALKSHYPNLSSTDDVTIITFMKCDPDIGLPKN